MNAEIFEGLLPWGLTPSELNGSEDAELSRRRSEAPTLDKEMFMATGQPVPGKVGTLSRIGNNLWTATSAAVAELAPDKKTAVQSLINRAKPGATLTGMLGSASIAEKQMAVEMMARGGYDMNRVDTVFHAFGLEARAEVMANVREFLKAESIAADASKGAMRPMSTVEKMIFFGQIKDTQNMLGLSDVDSLLKVANVLALLTEAVVVDYKATGLTTPQLNWV